MVVWPQGSALRLSGIAVTRPGHVKERRELTGTEFAKALTGEFALALTEDETAILVAAPTGR